jgi:cytochrome c-type biogenesis protein CcmH
MRRVAASIVMAAALAATPTQALAAASRASLTDIENDVMCVACREPLAVAQAPQAYAERNYIRSLIAQGKTKRQIEQALVAQYGPAVLAKPPAHGFNLTVYVLPPAILLLGAAILAFALPRWRRRTRATATPTSQPRLTPADARRLDEDLARYE